MYYYPDMIAQVVDQCGLRAYISATVIDQRSPDAESAADSLVKGQIIHRRLEEVATVALRRFGDHMPIIR